MDRSKFEVGKHYRGPHWSKGYFITYRSNGDCIKNWDGRLHNNITRTDYYECNNDGDKIEKRKFKIGDVVESNQKGYSGKIIIKTIENSKYTTDSGPIFFAREKDFDVVVKQTLRFQVGDIVKRIKGTQKRYEREITGVRGEWYITRDGRFKISIQNRFVLVKRLVSFEEWINGMAKGAKGYQNGNDLGFYTFDIPTLKYKWNYYMDDSDKNLYDLQSLDDKYGSGNYGLWLDWEESHAVTIDGKGNSRAVV